MVDTNKSEAVFRADYLYKSTSGTFEIIEGGASFILGYEADINSIFPINAVEQSGTELHKAGDSSLRLSLLYYHLFFSLLILINLVIS